MKKQQDLKIVLIETARGLSSYQRSMALTLLWLGLIRSFHYVRMTGTEQTDGKYVFNWILEY